jgi:tyrosine-specific transport protein
MEEVLSLYLDQGFIMNFKVFSGAMLVAGTAIGAGMLALPVATSLAGFLPSCVVFLACWLFMLSTGLLFLEISLWLPKGSNMLSMADHLLGKWGRAASCLLYLFLFYCLTVAYSAGGGGFVVTIAGEKISDWLGILLFTAFFSPVVYLGTRAVDRLNFVWMIALVMSYFAFVAMGWTKVDLDMLDSVEWAQSLIALPIIFTSFSFQGIIPSLITYLKYDVKMVRKALILGTSIPFICYVIWELLILGIVPVEGPAGLLNAKLLGQTAIFPLRNRIDFPYIYAIGQIFSFFALTTSFLGVTLGLMDFLADGLKLVGIKTKKYVRFFIVFLPPMLIAIFNPDVFLKALSYAGGIGCALLLGLLPIIMSWVGRYKKNYGRTTWQLRGGRLMLCILLCFTVLELVIEFFFH